MILRLSLSLQRFRSVSPEVAVQRRNPHQSKCGPRTMNTTVERHRQSPKGLSPYRTTESTPRHYSATSKRRSRRSQSPPKLRLQQSNEMSGSVPKSTPESSEKYAQLPWHTSPSHRHSHAQLSHRIPSRMIRSPSQTRRKFPMHSLHWQYSDTASSSYPTPSFDKTHRQSPLHPGPRSHEH